MSLAQINLIPASVLRGRAITRARRVWLGAVPPTMLMSLACAWGLLAFEPGLASADEQDTAQEVDAALLIAQEQQLLAEIELLEGSMASAEVARDRVDWLLLLGVVDTVRGEDVAVVSVEIRSRTDLTGVNVSISGAAVTTSAAMLFVERLRALELFSDVSLPRTAIDSVGRATFLIQARLDADTPVGTETGTGGSE